jgi:hypothetical protein
MLGLVGCLGSLTAAGATGLMKVVGGVDVTGNPLFLLTVFCGMIALQFFSLGLLGEVNARIYYASQPKQNYAVRELINMEPRPADQADRRAA